MRMASALSSNAPLWNMADLSIEHLVVDWGGFEELVKQLHQTGDVSVERNVTLIGRSGAPRQIDVLLRHRQGLYEHLVIIECKYWNTNVDRGEVDALATAVRDVGASKGVIFSTKGFQSGAITQARHEGIELYKVREPTENEWGPLGRHVNLYLHLISLALGPVTIAEAYPDPANPPTSNVIALTLDPNTKSDSATTPIEAESGKDKTLEGFLARLAEKAAKQIYLPRLASFDGSLRGKILTRRNVTIEQTRDIKVFVSGGCVLVRRMSFEIGLCIDQSHLAFDRARNFVFALAVENCVKREVFAASRRIGDQQTELYPLNQPNISSEQQGDVVRNNSIISIWLGAMFSFDEYRELQVGETKFVPVIDPPTPGAALSE